MVHTTFHWPHATDHECSHINWLDSRTIEETAKQKEKATGQFLFENGKLYIIGENTNCNCGS